MGITKGNVSRKIIVRQTMIMIMIKAGKEGNPCLGYILRNHFFSELFILNII